LTTSRCNGIGETSRHNRHNGLLPHANLLQTCYGESGVMDFGKTCYQEVANLLRTCYGLTSDTRGTSPTCYGL